MIGRLLYNYQKEIENKKKGVDFKELLDGEGKCLSCRKEAAIPSRPLPSKQAELVIYLASIVTIK